MNLVVRPERPADADAVRRINRAAFGRPVEAQIVDDLRGSDRWIAGGSLVAEIDGVPVGHLLLSEGDLVSGDGNLVDRIWMVGPVAVKPEHQRRGIGGALMRAAIAFAESRKQPVLCLLGHADYYPRFGFEPARHIGIEPPKPWKDENWLALRLPDWHAGVRGVAHFAPAFPE